MLHRCLGFFFVIVGMNVQAWADEVGFEPQFSFSGLSGVITTPNASVLEEGTWSFHYSNDHQPLTSDGQADNVYALAGLFPFLELGGRLWEQGRGTQNGSARDLSANFKLATPEPWHGISLAIGAQDFGGEAVRLNREFVVGSWSPSGLPLRGSLGYQRGDDADDGPFGGIEFDLFDHIELLSEFAPNEDNAGLRLYGGLLGAPQSWRWYVLGQYGIDRQQERTEFAVGLYLPIGLTRHAGPSSEPISTEALPPRAPLALEDKDRPRRKSPTERAADAGPSEPSADTPALLRRIGERLRSKGFEAVRLAQHETVLYTEFENNRYRRNALDGLGVALAVLSANAPESTQELQVVVLGRGTPLVHVVTDREAYYQWLRAGGSAPLKVVKYTDSSISELITSPESADIVTAEGKPSLARIQLKPSLRYALGTEVGVFDYALAFQAGIELPLWKGASLNPVWHLPVNASDDFDNSGAFSGFRDEPALKDVWFHQFLHPHPQVLNIVHAGRHSRQAERHIGALNETAWFSPNGTHRVSTEIGYFHGQNTDDKTTARIAYRYFHSRTNTAAEAGWERYFFQDLGPSVTVSRHFNDTTVSAFFRQVEESIVGVEVTLPFGLRRSLPPVAGVQVVGEPHWRDLRIRTTTLTDDDTNPVLTEAARGSRIENDLDDRYLDRDRLTPAYIRANADRLRHAWRSWGASDSAQRHQ